jgi:hypothetical protein
MKQTRKILLLLALAAVGLAGIGVAPAEAGFVIGPTAGLDTLISGGSLAVTDPNTGQVFTFSNFTYNPVAGPPTAANVTISGYEDSAGNVGIQIGGGFTAFTPTTPNPNDLRIGYRVTTSGPGITDLHLSGNPAISPVGATGAVTVTESVSAPGLPLTPPIQIYAINNLGTPVVQSTDQMTFGSAFTTLDVTKDILLVEGTGVPSISFINQTFSTAVPEPGSMILMGLGCLGMAGYGLRRRRSMAG